MTNKYKATINIDRELWDKFKAKCDGMDTTASEEVRRFISLFVLEEETQEFDPYEYDQYPNSLKKTYDRLEGRLSLSFDQRFDRINKRIDAMEKLFNLGKIWDETFEFVAYQRLDKDGTEAGTDTGTDTRTDTGTDTGTEAGTEAGTDTGTDTRTDTGTDTGTDTRTDTGTEVEAEPQTNSAELKSPYKKFSNTEVAKIEGLTQTTVSRYWTGARNPKDATFWDRWAKDKHDQGWLKANKP